MWIGWALVLLVIAVVVVIAYAVYGLAPLLITTTVPVAVVVIGIVLVLLSLLITMGRRRERRAAERARREAQQEAWARHQQFLRRLDHELKNPLTAVRAAVADLPQAHPQELQARWVRRDRARHSSVEVLSQDCDRVGTPRRQRFSNVLGVTKVLISLRQGRRPRRCQGKQCGGGLGRQYPRGWRTSAAIPRPASRALRAADRDRRWGRLRPTAPASSGDPPGSQAWRAARPLRWGCDSAAPRHGPPRSIHLLRRRRRRRQDDADPHPRRPPGRRRRRPRPHP